MGPCKGNPRDREIQLAGGGAVVNWHDGGIEPGGEKGASGSSLWGEQGRLDVAWEGILKDVLVALSEGSWPGLVLVGDLPTGDLIAQWLKIRLGLLGIEGFRGDRVIEVSDARVKSKVLREGMRQRLDDGDAWVAVATRVWGTGIDIPNVQWVALDPGVGAPDTVIQAGGRGSRIGGGPDFRIFVGDGPHRQRQLDALAAAGYEGGKGVIPPPDNTQLVILPPSPEQREQVKRIIGPMVEDFKRELHKGIQGGGLSLADTVEKVAPREPIQESWVPGPVWGVLFGVAVGAGLTLLGMWLWL
jgi:hypothetical protein